MSQPRNFRDNPIVFGDVAGILQGEMPTLAEMQAAVSECKSTMSADIANREPKITGTGSSSDYWGGDKSFHSLPAGPKGEKGDRGDIGLSGVQGLTGPKGDAGGIGPIGPAGPFGAKGDTGLQGPSGSQGPIGATGATGATGAAGAPANTLIGNVTIGQTAVVAISLGIREITVALPGTTVGGKYQAFATTYTLNGGSSVSGRPSGYALVDCVCNVANQITISLHAPLLAIGSAYTLTCAIVRINT